MEKSILDIYWILMAAALVFLMQPGFLCLESGLTRSKNSIGVAAKNLSDFIVSVFMFWIVGYGIMYGATQAGIIGGNSFCLNPGGDAYTAAFFFFQAMFCGTATTIFSGAVAERMRFGAYVIVAVLLSALIYPMFGHWAWNGVENGESTGWLGWIGFVDFAGSTVVHSVGGWVALAALLVIGPRQGRFSKDGLPLEINASNLPFSLLGALLLWMGWFGFNGGSTLAMDGRVPMIIVNTTLAGVGGAMVCLLYGWFIIGVPKIGYLINGSIGGLVAVTANCHAVNAPQSVLIGIIAGFVYMAADRLMLARQIDDAVGAVPVHLGCGIWGTLAVAVFGDPLRLETGLNRMEQLGAQAAGILAAFVVAFALPYIILRGIDRIFPLRVSVEAEDIGLNISEHGARTDLLDLFDAMDHQVKTRDLSIRLPVAPFTETGRIAARYNAVMDALEEAVAQTEAIIRTAKDAIIAFSQNNLKVLCANPAASMMFGYDAAALSDMSAATLFDSECESPQALFDTFGQKHKETMGKRQNGASFPMEAVIAQAMAGQRRFYIGTFRDLTERKQARAVISKQKAYFTKLFESSPQAIVMLDAEARVRAANLEFTNLFGFKNKEIQGKRNRDLVVPQDRQTEADAFNHAVLSGHAIQKESFRKHKTGRLIPVSILGYPIEIDGRIEGVFYIYEDISERKAFEAQLHQKAFYDYLTGIPNRILFMERLERAMERTKRRDDYGFALLLLDIDRFKWVNDSLGHLAGDDLLVQAAQRFSECIRSVDTVARLGGDEYALLIEETKSKREVIQIAKRLEDAAKTPFIIQGQVAHLSSSIGIVLKTKGYQKAEDILRDADIAMYRAKELGKARFKVFNRKMHKVVFERLKIENELRDAIDKEQLSLYYQPIVSVKNRRLDGFEALVRWNHPVDGVVSPIKFIPIAEEIGLILPLGRWVIQRACRDLASWRQLEPDAKHLKVSVNISAKQFLQRDLADFIDETLKQAGLPPNVLRVELTETVIMEHANTAVEQLRRLKTIGVTVAIDDFGTGYSSLSYLQRFPIDCLKIDKSFIEGLGLVDENTEIVKTVLSLAKNLGIGVVAEGVEEESQLAQLNALSCDNAQGYLFSKPVAEDGAMALIRKYFI